VPESRRRERNPAAKRARIAQAALELFKAQGFADTTIDQIAEAADVGRRTIFEHFSTKEAILFDHLVVRREGALEQLRARPADEPPIVSLHEMMRYLSDQGYDRSFLDQIRAVLAAEPGLTLQEISMGDLAFHNKAVEILQSRPGASAQDAPELHALTEMVMGWFLTAVRVYFKERRPSLKRCYEDIAAACVRASVEHLS
jgi:AcrR family transcriptional regulator